MIAKDIISFYNGGTNSDGISLAQILKADDHFLESNHLYIQWLFPNREPSFFNPNSPVLEDYDINYFLKDTYLINKVKMALDKMMKFYHIDRMSAYHFDKVPLWWVTEGNHNFLRCTRILNTLREFKMYEELNLFYDKLIKIYFDNLDIISPTTLNFWVIAHGGNFLNYIPKAK